MSSTSSNECECDPYWPYESGHNTNYRNAFGGNPYYPTMGYPMVYYAQAPCPRNLTHRGRDRERGSPNCFVKAFRWYTKDHIPNRSESPINPDMTGFAAWLDIKYDQFLQENQLGSEMYHVKLRQTFEAEKVPINNNCEPCAQSFLAKSPWKNKRRAKSNETGDVRQKSNQSCRYIMQPKETVSRSPSVCCHLSNTTASEGAKKQTLRSRSFSNITLVIKGKEPRDVTPAPCDKGDTKPKADASHTSCKLVNSKQSVEKIDVLTENKTTISRDIGCQFCGDTTTKVNAETQYDIAVPPNSRRSSLPSNKSECLADCHFTSREKSKQQPARTNYTPDTNENTSSQPILPHDFSSSVCGCKPLGTTLRKSNNVHKNTSMHSENYVKSRPQNNIECQCPEEKVVTIDAQTQYVVCQCPNKEKALNVNTQTHKVECQNAKENVVNTNAQTQYVEYQSPKEYVVNANAQTQYVLECQCPKEKVVSANVSTQLVQYPTASLDNNVCDCDLKGPVQYIQPPIQSVPIQTNQLPLYTCESKIKREPVTVKFAQTTSQTSNHSICLDKGTVQKYPLFLKIVCADKLSNENMK